MLELFEGRSRAKRTALAAVLAAALAGLATAGRPASALGPVSAPSLPGAAPSVPLPPLPTATPTPSPLPTPSVALPGIPAPAPPLPGGGLTVPGSTPPGGPAPGAAPHPAPAAAPPASATAVPGSLLAQIDLSNPFLGAQVSAILANPVAPQAPDLRHLSFVASGPTESGIVPAGTSAAAHSGRTTGAVLLLLLGAFALGAAGLLAWLLVARRPQLVRAAAAMRTAPGLAWLRDRGRPGLGRRLALAGAVPAIVLVGLTVLGVHHFTAPSSDRLALAGSARRVTIPARTVADLQIRSGATSATDAAPATAPAPAPAGSEQPVAGPARPARAASVAPAPPAVLLELRGLEERIATAHDRLASAETAVADRSAAPLSADNPAAQTRALQAAVAEREAAVNTYNAALASEYAFYRDLAGDPTRSNALVAAVQSLGRRDLVDGVVYNLQVVRTQLAEERALAALSAGSPVTGAALAAIPSGPTALRLPFNGVFTQPFGPTSFGLEAPLIYQGVFYPHFHTGLDLAAPLDTPVGAGATGVVVFAGQSVSSSGQLVGYGNYVVIAHANGYQTLYGHLDHILVKPGQVVAAGQPIGLEGSTGWSTGPHTHFELRHLREAVDPMPYLQGQPLS